MLSYNHDANTCTVCGQYKNMMKPCNNCATIEKLKGLACPCCKGTDIHLSQTFESNGIMGPGSSSWVTSENFVCMSCGVMFLDVRKK